MSLRFATVRENAQSAVARSNLLPVLVLAWPHSRTTGGKYLLRSQAMIRLSGA
jgi:hypothetical protein